MSTSADRSNNLDVIRFVAAAAVIYGHAFPLNSAGSPGFLSNSVQTIGVKVFFMLSGLLIAQSWLSDPHVLRFAARRALRLFPALAVVLLLSVFVLGPVFTTLPLREYFSNERTWRYLGNIGLNITYDLPGVFAANPYKNAVNGSLWSLPVEVCMYLATPVVLTLATLLRRPRLVLWLVTIVSVLASAWFVRTPGHQSDFVAYGIGLTSLLDVAPFFAVGALCCVEGWQKKVSPQTAVLVFFLAVMFPSLTPVVDELVLMVLVPVLVLGLGFAENPRFARAGRFGDVSYGLYLYGFAVQQVVTALAGKAISPQLNAAIALVICIVCAWASWHLVEKRALARRPRAPARTEPFSTARTESATVRA
jgi:peptidoglycan/LPS O-acetylase OafA/YrhL